MTPLAIAAAHCLSKNKFLVFAYPIWFNYVDNVGNIDVSEYENGKWKKFLIS